MDISDKLFDAAKTLSKTAWLTVLAVVSISVYLMQRALGVFLEVAIGASIWALQQKSSISETDLARPQSGILGLSFSFAAMTLFWPLVLGFLCVAFGELVSRHNNVAKRLSDTLPSNESPGLECLDPFSIATEATSIPGSRFLWQFVKRIPLFALAFHGISDLMIAATVIRGAPAMSGSDRVIWFREFNPVLLKPFWRLASVQEFLLLSLHLAVMLSFLIIGWRWVRTFADSIDRARTLVVPSSAESALAKGV